MKDIINRISNKIKKFLETGPEDFEKGGRLGEEIVEISDELRDLIYEDKPIERYNEINTELTINSAKLSRDLINLRESKLESEWRQFAVQNLSKLKDNVLALKEFLSTHGEDLRKRFYEEKYGVSLPDLAHHLREEDSVGKITRTKFLKLIKDMGDREAQEKMKKFKKRVNRISKWVFALEELRSELKFFDRKKR